MAEIYVVGVDGSEGSVRTAQYAVDHAAKTNAVVKIIHILEWSPYTFLTNEELAERHKRRKDELERAKTAILDLVVTKINEQGVSIEEEVRYGHISEQMQQYCDEVGASHMYVGRHGGGSISTRIFGSVPGALVQISNIPVTVVP
ncbi:MAG: universal stress protein [Gammaproteobacteria bacterium]|nr:universal stress protein [Gammaproteobacteria bacterium]